MEETDAPPAKVKPCTLDSATRELVKLIFDTDMFRDTMKSMDIGEYQRVVRGQGNLYSQEASPSYISRCTGVTAAGVGGIGQQSMGVF